MLTEENRRLEINEEALFADTTEAYFSPSEPNPYSQVTIRFRTARDGADSVYMVTITCVRRRWKKKNFRIILRFT